jgi:hypothetical protein
VLPPLREVAEIRKPSTLGGVIYLCVLVAALAGVGIAATAAWRTGVSWLAVALIGAAVARVVLPDDNAGMLRVRRKALDAAILTSAGSWLLFLALRRSPTSRGPKDPPGPSRLCGSGPRGRRRAHASSPAAAASCPPRAGRHLAASSGRPGRTACGRTRTAKRR